MNKGKEKEHYADFADLEKATKFLKRDLNTTKKRSPHSQSRSRRNIESRVLKTGDGIEKGWTREIATKREGTSSATMSAGGGEGNTAKTRKANTVKRNLGLKG